jgi:hypothetical protein
MTPIDKEALDILIEEIPIDPPLAPMGEITISEMYPDLTEEEFDYIRANYTGRMQI